MCSGDLRLATQPIVPGPSFGRGAAFTPNAPQGTSLVSSSRLTSEGLGIFSKAPVKCSELLCRVAQPHCWPSPSSRGPVNPDGSGLSVSSTLAAGGTATASGFHSRDGFSQIGGQTSEIHVRRGWVLVPACRWWPSLPGSSAGRELPGASSFSCEDTSLNPSYLPRALAVCAQSP